MLKDMAENPSEWEGKKVLFVHTGGLLGMYDKVQQLQPLIGKWERFKIAQAVLKDGDGKGKMFWLIENVIGMHLVVKFVIVSRTNF